VKVLFCVSHPGFVRNLRPVFVALVGRGHQVDVLFERERNGSDLLLASLDDLPRLSWGFAPDRRRAALPAIGRRLRLALDHLRFLEDNFAESPRLRERARIRVPRVLRIPGLQKQWVRSFYRKIIGRAETIFGAGGDLDPLLTSHTPDVVVLSPFLELGSPQTDYVRSAKRLGIATVGCVSSWDSLTIKGIIREQPDRLLVWNRAQKQDAITLHGMQPGRVEVVGAFPYDHWFNWRSSEDASAFATRVGLDPERPFLLYVCSSPFVAPDERTFVRRWRDELRQRGGWLSSVGILVRPHPQHGSVWRDLGGSGLTDVVVWPPTGADPVDHETRDDYYLSLRHATAVVGVNTSAMVEAGIIGRPIFTVVTEEFLSTQEGTLHFQQLVESASGILTVAKSLREHAEQLEEPISIRPVAEAKETFVRRAIRPYGSGEPCALRTAKAVESAAALSISARRRVPGERVVRVLVGRPAQPLVNFIATMRDRKPRFARRGT
jgi:hypothetical protein